jgi:hypothetical protein
MMHLVRGSMWGGVVLLLLVGCTAQRRGNYLRDRAGEHVYKQPLSEIWPRVQAVLEERGYSWREKPRSFILETEWKENGGGTLGHSYTRFLVEGLRLKSGGSVLRVLRNDASSQPTAVHYAGRTGPITSAKAANNALIDAANSNTTGMTAPQRAAYRDLELEWDLLQAIDPEAAAALEADAQARYPK